MFKKFRKKHIAVEKPWGRGCWKVDIAFLQYIHVKDF